MVKRFRLIIKVHRNFIKKHMADNPPIVGATMKAYCNCAKTETVWTIQKEHTRSSGSNRSGHRYGGGGSVYYHWVCLNCGKERFIGEWKETK